MINITTEIARYAEKARHQTLPHIHRDPDD